MQNFISVEEYYQYLEDTGKFECDSCKDVYSQDVRLRWYNGEYCQGCIDSRIEKDIPPLVQDLVYMYDSLHLGGKYPIQDSSDIERIERTLVGMLNIIRGEEMKKLHEELSRCE